MSFNPLPFVIMWALSMVMACVIAPGIGSITVAATAALYTIFLVVNG